MGAYIVNALIRIVGYKYKYLRNGGGERWKDFLKLNFFLSFNFIINNI